MHYTDLFLRHLLTTSLSKMSFVKHRFDSASTNEMWAEDSWGNLEEMR